MLLTESTTSPSAKTPKDKYSLLKPSAKNNLILNTAKKYKVDILEISDIEQNISEEFEAQICNESDLDHYTIEQSKES